MCHPFALITSSTRSCILLVCFLTSLIDSSSQTCWTAAQRPSREFHEPGISATRVFSINHKGSMGFKSGEDGGCSRLVIPSSLQMFFATVLRWHGAPSSTTRTSLPSSSSISSKKSFKGPSRIWSTYQGPLSPPPFFFPVVVVTSGTRFKRIIGPFRLWVTLAHTMIDLRPLLNIGDMFSGRNSSPGRHVTIAWLGRSPSSIEDSSV